MRISSNLPSPLAVELADALASDRLGSPSATSSVNRQLEKTGVDASAHMKNDIAHGHNLTQTKTRPQAPIAHTLSVAALTLSRRFRHRGIVTWSGSRLL